MPSTTAGTPSSRKWGRCSCIGLVRGALHTLPDALSRHPPDRNKLILARIGDWTQLRSSIRGNRESILEGELDDDEPEPYMFDPDRGLPEGRSWDETPTRDVEVSHSAKGKCKAERADGGTPSVALGPTSPPHPPGDDGEASYLPAHHTQVPCQPTALNPSRTPCHTSLRLHVILIMFLGTLPRRSPQRHLQTI